MKIKIKHVGTVLLPFIVLIALSTLLTGCARTHQARSVEPSGFLSNVDQLKAGEEGQALLIYVDDQINFHRYNKILIDPIKAYAAAEDSSFSKMDPEELKALLDYFDAAIREQLKGDFQFVTTPGPNTMRFRVAVLEAEGSKVVRDVISSVLPYGMALSVLKRGVTGKASAVGEASVEFEAVDSQTGKRLVAAIDRRIGNKYTGTFDKLNRWRAVQAAFDFWAERLHIRLQELRNVE